MANKTSMHYVIWALVALLIIFHQDNWLWESGTLVLGFIPIGLFYHACISMAASATWLLATRFAWPNDLELVDDTSDTEGAK